jgi:hypothetical protein
MKFLWVILLCSLTELVSAQGIGVYPYGYRNNGQYSGGGSVAWGGFHRDQYGACYTHNANGSKRYVRSVICAAMNATKPKKIKKTKNASK